MRLSPALPGLEPETVVERTHLVTADGFGYSKRSLCGIKDPAPRGADHHAMRWGPEKVCPSCWELRDPACESPFPAPKRVPNELPSLNDQTEEKGDHR